MRLIVCILLFLATIQAVSATTRHPYQTLPFLLIPQRGIESSHETLTNMRLGCTATAKSDEASKRCIELVEKMHSLLSFAKAEITQGELAGSTMTKGEKDDLLAAIDKKYLEIREVSDEILRDYPYVRFYIAPYKRLAI